MQEVKFPGLNLEFHINRVAMKIGEIEIYWYAIFISLAFIIALLLCKRDNGKYNINFDIILELLIIVIPVAILGARIYYVLFKLEDYIRKPIEIFNIRAGGLAIYGGIIGAFLTIYIYCKKKNVNVLDMLDYVVPYLPLGQAIGRFGNFFNEEAYGIETTNLFRMGIVEKNRYIEVHPTFLYEVFCNFIIFMVLYCIRNKRNYKGELTYIYLFLYGIVRSAIEELRSDSLMIGNFRISQLISIALACIFGGVLIYKKLKNRNNKNMLK